MPGFDTEALSTPPEPGAPGAVRSISSSAKPYPPGKLTMLPPCCGAGSDPPELDMGQPPQPLRTTIEHKESTSIARRMKPHLERIQMNAQKKSKTAIDRRRR